MEQRHRDAIARNMTALVNETYPDVEVISNSLLHKGIFNKRMADLYLNKETPAKERAQELYLYVETRGPMAFRKLVDTLIETAHPRLAKVLDPGCRPEAHVPDGDSAENYLNELSGENGARNHPRCHPNVLPQYMINANGHISDRLHTMGTLLPSNSLINVGTEPSPVKVIMAVERLDIGYKEDLHVYPMGSRPKGLVLMINNVEFVNDIRDARDGAEVDEANLCTLFEQMGYEVRNYRDQSLQQMKQLVEEFACDPDLRRVCSIVVVVMSHGRDQSLIVTQDDQLLDPEWIIGQFDGDECPAMLLKPKIFLFATCRGNKLEQQVIKSYRVTNRTKTDGAAGDMHDARTTGDMLIAHSTLPGYVANRDTFKGTWFIQAICEVFAKHACNTDIEDMLKMVDARMSRLLSEHKTKQTSCYENRGFRKFYFVPGLYDSPPSDHPPLPSIAATPTVTVATSVDQYRPGVPDVSAGLVSSLASLQVETMSIELSTNQTSYVA